MEYTISIKELISRPIIRDDKIFKWQNKMTDVEIQQWNDEVEESRIESGDNSQFYQMMKEQDRDILYRLFCMKQIH